MPLKLVKRHGVWHIRGTVGGTRIQESTRTADKRLAEKHRAKREAEAHTEELYGRRAPSRGN